MKILFLTRYYLPHVGGIEQNIFKISSYLKEGNDITVMTVKGSGLPLREEMHGVNVVRRPYLDFLHEDLHKYNVVFLENFNLLLIILIIVNICLSTMIKKKKYRLVFVPHGGFTPYWEIFRPVVRFIKKTIHRTIGIFFVNSFVEKVVAVSTWEQNELRQVGVTKPILLIGNGFETMPISKDVIKGKYIIFVGRIDKIKNLEGMIIMFSKLLKSNFFRGWKLHIIGNSPRDVEYVEKLKKLSEETGVIDSVCFFGVVRGEEKMLHIAKAQLLICISFFETDPIVVKEALSVKTKVLISGNYGLGDYVDNPNSFTIYENELDVDDIIAFINSPFVETADFVGWKEISEQYKKLLLGSDF